MNNPVSPVNASSHSRGLTIKRVVIKGISGGLASCDDGTGNLVSVPMAITRAKGAQPAVGEIWYLTREFGPWTFAAINGYSPREGLATMANAATTTTVTFANPEPDAAFGVALAASWNSGAIWYTVPALTGFTINVVTAPSGPGQVAWKLIRNST